MPLPGLLGIWLVATAANLGKPVHMDDSTYLVMARHIAEHPLHPMSMSFVSSGSLWPASSTNQPHLLLYGFAAVMKAFGESQLALHLFESIFAALAIGFFYALARRLCPQCALALTAVFALGPAFLPAQNLMTDVPMVALWLMFFWLLFAAGDSDRPARLLVGAGVVAGAACLVKYTSVILIPLILLPAMIPGRGAEAQGSGGRGSGSRDDWMRRLGAALIPIGALIAWSLFNLFDYGEIHILTRQGNVGEFSTPAHRVRTWLMCLGAVAPFSIVALFAAERRRALAVATALATAAAAIVFWRPLSESPPWSALLGGLFLANGIFLTAAACVRAAGAWSKQRRDTALLVGWIVGGSGFAIALAPFMAVRHVLPVLPAFLLLLGRSIESAGARRALLAGGLATAALGAAVALADWQYADMYRSQAHALRERLGEETRIWYLGNWGWRWYAEEAGMRHYMRDRDELDAGDWMIMPRGVSGPRHVAPRHRGRVEQVEVVTVESKWPLLPRIMLPLPAGGFYAVGVEGLPWTFSDKPLEQFRILRVLSEDGAS